MIILIPPGPKSDFAKAALNIRHVKLCPVSRPQCSCPKRNIHIWFCCPTHGSVDVALYGFIANIVPTIIHFKPFMFAIHFFNWHYCYNILCFKANYDWNTIRGKNTLIMSQIIQIHIFLLCQNKIKHVHLWCFVVAWTPVTFWRRVACFSNLRGKLPYDESSFRFYLSSRCLNGLRQRTLWSRQW